MDVVAAVNLLGTGAIVGLAIAWMTRKRRRSGCESGGCDTAQATPGATVKVPTSALSLGRSKAHSNQG